jgi:hypothetical protein
MIWLLLLPMLARADCDDLRIQNLQNVDFTNDSSPTEDFRVKRNGNGSCQFFVTVDNGGASSAQARRLYHGNHADTVPVQICIDSSCASVLKSIQEASSSSDVLSGQFSRGSGDDKNLVYRPRLGSTDYERYGTYEANFTMRLYAGTLHGWHSLADTESFRLRYRMEKRIDLSLVSPGAPFDRGATSKNMNFGPLREGSHLDFDLVIKTNAGYRVRMESQNRGKLVYRSSSVPYRLSLRGAAVSLDREITVAQGTGASGGGGGYRLPGRITISALGNAQAGTYADVITVRVSTTE